MVVYTSIDPLQQLWSLPNLRCPLDQLDRREERGGERGKERGGNESGQRREGKAERAKERGESREALGTGREEVGERR